MADEGQNGQTDVRHERLAGIFLVSAIWLLLLLPAFAGLVAWEFEYIRLYLETR